MKSTLYERWRSEPFPVRLPDDDSGYRGVALHHSDLCMAKVTDCITRCPYDGVSIHGKADESLRLPGGLKDGAMYGVEHVVKAIEFGNAELKTMSGGTRQLVALEFIRTPKRQEAGNRDTHLKMLAQAGIKRPTPAQIYQYGVQADEIFSYVGPDVTRSEYAALVKKLLKNDKLLAELRQAAGIPGSNPIDGILAEYIAMAVNLGGVEDVSEAGLILPGSMMVHGGSAVDLMIADEKGCIRSLLPYDYLKLPGAIAYRWTENPANREVLIAQAKVCPILGQHFRDLGFSTPDDLTTEVWNDYAADNRVQVKLLIKLGAITYGPERWHYEIGTLVFGLDGKPALKDQLFDEFPISGGPGFTVVKNPMGQAVYHTAVTQAALRKQGLLVE
ncbi:MAG: hypothetical protein HOO67_01870 [Candidatus Peribacteraceae bacterium]|nr:hypothetical protein [Candidatus Peribacteraceae bacterium]